MNTEQMQRVINLGEKMIENNYNLIKTMTKMPPDEQLEYFPKVMSSIEHNQKQLNDLIHATGVNQL